MSGIAPYYVSIAHAAVGAAVAVYGFGHAPLWLYPLLWAVVAECISQGIEGFPRSIAAPWPKDDGRRVGIDELARHNTEESAWIAISGVVYDITAWLDRHPGGKEHLLLAAGRDCTDLFESYHPLSFGTPRDPTLVLPKLRIGTLVSRDAFPVYARDTGLYREMRERVAEHFRKTGKDPKDPRGAIVRMTAVVAVAAVAFWIQYTTTSTLVRILASIVFGSCQAIPLLHVMHDASHTAVGHSESVWKWAGRFFMDWYAGASMTSWHNQHVIGHHIHTNIVDFDPDLPVDMENDIRRLVPRQIWHSHYRYQHLYLLPLYSLLGLKFRFQDIVCTFMSRFNGPIPVNPISILTWSKQVASKLNFLIWRIAIPLYYFNISFPAFVATFLFTEMITGWYLALNFQVSHVSVAAEFPESDVAEKYEWAKLQIVGSVDYSHGDPIMTFICGALNYQTIHHLFPSISQYHYPAIADIVMDVCKKRGVKYNKLGGFWDALGAHVALLRKMGLEEEKTHSAAGQKKRD